MGNQVIRHSERPELLDAITTLSEEVWPEYNLHGDVLGGYWDRLYDEFAAFQFVLYPSLSTSGETLTIEESMNLEGENGERRNVGDEHEWGWARG